MPSSRVLPQNCLRASSQPSAMPNGSAQTVATIEMRKDSATAVHSSGVRPSTIVLTVFGGFGRLLYQNREAVLLKNRLGGRRAQERQIRGCIGLGIHGCPHRVDDRVMRVFRER